MLTGIVTVSTRVAFSQDSRYLYAGYAGDIGIWSTVTWKFEDFVTDYTVGVYDVAYSADSRLVAGCSYRYAFVYESETGVRRDVLWGPSGFPDFYSLSFSPDGHNLAGSTLDGNVYIWDVDRDTMKTILARDTVRLRWLSYSPDGRQIAVVANDSIIFWNVARRSVDTIWTGPEFPTSSLAYSTDGKYLATDGTGNMVRIWNAATGALEYSFGPEQTPAVRTKFSPDGSLIASGYLDGEAVVRRVADGQVLRRFHHRDMVTGIGFLPDGKHLVTGSLDSAVIVWDLETGKDVYSYTSYPSNVLRLAVSPDGRYIASGTYDALVLYRAHDGTSGVADRAAAPYDATAITSRPNPARDITTVEFSIAGPDGSVIPSTVSLLDMFGREVLTVLDRRLEPGRHSAVIDCSALPQGIYFVRLATPSGTSVRELRVVR
jgi:WD40 repeat protein